MKRFRCMWAAVMALVLCLCGCARTQGDPADGQAAAATVNGETVTRDEVAYYAAKLRADVIYECREEFSAVYDDGFWTRPCGDSTPEQLLQARATDAAIRSKLLLMLMREKGIYDDISFAALREKAETFNREHTQNKVGLKTISMTEFYTYYVENGVLELKNRLTPSELGIDEKEISSLSQQIMQTEEDIQPVEAEAIARSRLTDQYFDEYTQRILHDASIVLF